MQTLPAKLAYRSLFTLFIALHDNTCAMEFRCTVTLKLFFRVECLLTLVTFERSAKVSMKVVFRVEPFLTIVTCDGFHWFFWA